ncbi:MULTISPECIES: TRAP transporter small permease [unclassified Paenibacillus]|uniref:TRAP transporter small permease n=1 Tax=unclassified Paenibacillus TaxID=185978 RepID=UPI001AE775EF|nr:MULTISPECIES: TRAP transporter small permease [unclassified Paenibacillus]MBP1154079.1 TRAP-type C4-dicarboxylate transport system permease small subunit [Paenibacillus sp. PvP091]MBP1170536.1 TRAP-type C4-dicarboxylate transport system permease small subunit [Paenibacillus sp. PvR098]MBP2441564.1 TRAP-type C4-dicarboxylate transport system permease small subunit [Paenibacillus sp. PvP052]
MTFVRKLSDGIFFIERILACVFLLFMVTSLILGVIFRYFLHSPLSWSDEFGMFALVWITFIGGSMSIKTNRAAAVGFVMEKLPVAARQIFFGIAFMISLLFCVFLLYLSMKWITNPSILLQKSPAVGLPMIIPYIAIPLGFLFMAVHSLDLFAGVFQKQQREGT